MLGGNINTARDFIVRHRYTVWDGVMFLGVAAVLLFFALEYDLLSADGVHRSKVAQIEFGEALLIAVVLGIFLFVAVRRMRAQSREVRQRMAAERKARMLASQDPLTGLANRRQFDHIVAAALGERPGADRCHAVVLLDLNGFKLINDAFGHPVGDAVLREIALRLASVARETGDSVARLGGDEFGIVATHLLGVEAASSIALRVIDALRAPIRIDDTEHLIGVAIGIALFPRDGASPGEIIRRADVALYRSKDDPQSAYHFFAAEMDVQIRERSFLESALRRACQNEEIRPIYSPITNLKTDGIVGFQLQPKWHQEKLGNVPPMRFLPVAESCGLGVQLGLSLLQQACKDACFWPPSTILSVQLSQSQLRDRTFGLRVLAILGETGLLPQRLELEITENLLVRDLETVQMALGRLHNAGVRIALNNFGAGYSSLYHLRTMKFDRITIDRSFVADMIEKTDNGLIVKALVGLGHGLGVEIAAEGIESSEQREALVSEGCDQGQGLLFKQPLSAVEAQALFDGGIAEVEIVSNA